MQIAGGLYREECIVPYWSRILGSGGRAATAISLLSPGSILYAYACREWVDDALQSLNGVGIEVKLTEIAADICFKYFHPLSIPQFNIPFEPVPTPLKVTGDAVLSFGFIEGEAVVSAKRAVYDPQHFSQTLKFTENGSSAEELAIVLNEHELEQGTGLSGREAVDRLIKHSRCRLVVVKQGAKGATIFDDCSHSSIPAYRSDTVFKIGSGDIFSAVFAHHWAERNLPPAEAADLASRSVAAYVSSRDLQVSRLAFQAEPVAARNETPRVYLAGPFFSIGQRWLVEEARAALLALGANVFSPLHELGIGGDPHTIAEADLKGLQQCSAVLALVDDEDLGTVFEVGYARSRNIPVIAFTETPRSEDLFMLRGTDCDVVNDFCTAIYRTIWAALR